MSSNLCSFKVKWDGLKTDLSPEEKMFVSGFESNVKSTIDRFNLFDKNDKILVAVSGGKDSSVLLYVLHKLGYSVEAFTIDVAIGCYTKENLERIRYFCKYLNIPLHESSFREEFGYSVCYIREMLHSKGNNITSCTVCGVLRRNILNKSVRALKADKLALGHNLDDEAQAVFMNLIKNRVSLNSRLGPVASSSDELFVRRVKPLYLTREEDVVEYAKILSFPVKFSRCPCSFDGTRNLARDFFDEYLKINPDVRENVVENFVLKNKSSSASSLSRCSSCGEPSSSAVCRSCQLISLID